MENLALALALLELFGIDSRLPGILMPACGARNLPKKGPSRCPAEDALAVGTAIMFPSDVEEKNIAIGAPCLLPCVIGSAVGKAKHCWGRWRACTGIGGSWKGAGGKAWVSG